MLLLQPERFEIASACALAIFSGKIILIFAVQQSLRALLNCFFTGRVVAGNESVFFSVLALSVTFGDSSPKGRAKNVAGKFLPLPAGELSRSD